MNANRYCTVLMYYLLNEWEVKHVQYNGCSNIFLSRLVEDANGKSTIER